MLLAAVPWMACSIGMTMLNKLAVTKTSAPLGVVMVQMTATCVVALASRDLHCEKGHEDVGSHDPNGSS